MGKSLRKELTAGFSRNLLISGEVLQEMSSREPDSLALLIEALKSNSLAIVGGELSEVPLPMLSPETIDFHLQRAVEIYQQILQQRPMIFGRRRFGLTPVLPQILAKNGFTAALHFTLDDGQFPIDNQSRIQWEGFDGTAIEALGRLPLDANGADSFFRLSNILGTALDLDSAATLLFAHWPGHVSFWYDDLKRIASYSRVLGAFYTLDVYFQQTSMAGRRVQFNADQYRSPYLAQDVAAGQADPLSRWVRYYRRRAICESAQTLYTLAILALKTPAPETACGFATKHQELLEALDDSLNINAPADPQLNLRLQQNIDAAGQLFSQSLGTKPRLVNGADSSRPGYLLLNPCSFSQRVGANLLELGTPPTVKEPIQAAVEKEVVVDLPGMGFAWIGPGEGTVPIFVSTKMGLSPLCSSLGKKAWLFGKKQPAMPPLAEENILRNEFFEVFFDPPTGAIRAIRDYRSRHPRLAQQIALRMPHAGEQDPTSELHYSIMSAEEIRITSPGPLCGEIVSRGKIMDRQGRCLAGFQQTARAGAGAAYWNWKSNSTLSNSPAPIPGTRTMPADSPGAMSPASYIAA